MIKDQMTDFFTDLTAHDYECLVFECINEVNILVRTSDPYLAAQYRFVRIKNVEPDTYRFDSYNIARCGLLADVDEDIPFEGIIESYIHNLGRAWNLIRYYRFNGTKAVSISSDLSKYYKTDHYVESDI